MDTFSVFPKEPNVEKLRAYHQKFPEIFRTYFLYHCQDTDERLNNAIEKYTADWESIKKVHQSIGDLIEEAIVTYETKYRLEFPVTVNLIIGAYGSNAYTHREIIPDITFAMERLSFEEDPLRVIIAHEFGHAAHNIISQEHQMNWKNVQWNHPYVTLLQEGAATHFSKKIVPNLNESIYFSYDHTGDEWLKFAKEHKEDIISSFAIDIKREKENVQIYKEWFSINGGSKFGFSRFGYFIADCFFQDSLHKIGELDTLLLWKNEGFFSNVEEWLNKFVPTNN